MYHLGKLQHLNMSDVELQPGGVKRNYNIDFLLIHLRDTLHSLSDDETKFREGNCKKDNLQR
jgi:hypothetical protein